MFLTFSLTGFLFMRLGVSKYQTCGGAINKLGVTSVLFLEIVFGEN